MVFKSEKGLSDAELRAALEEYVDERMTRLAEQRRESGRDAGGRVRVLMLPPDFTRMYSGAGHITAMLTEIFAARAEEIEWGRYARTRNACPDVTRGMRDLL